MTASRGNGSRDVASPADDLRIGVFICHCGGNIADVVDVERVAAEVGRLPHVVLATTTMFLCSDPGQALIEEKVRELALNRVVVAACSPSLHAVTFRRTVKRAGLNPFLFEHVNVREHVSWVVEDHELATQKAIRLVRAAVGRAANLVPLEKRRIPIRSEALVIGGGVAGLVAARDLARRGMRVTLVENRPFLGGRVAQWRKLAPEGDDARELLSTLMQDVVKQPLVKILTNARVVDASGVVGDFRTKVRLEPRGVDASLRFPGNAIAACPEETVNEFDFALSRRKAIYMPHPGCYPPMPAIDWGSCTRCGKCVAAVAGKGIDLDAKPREIEIRSGVVVLATGIDPYEPIQGEYGFGRTSHVVTLQQLYRMLDPDGPTHGDVRVPGGTPMRIAFIHCVGARQVDGVDQPQPDGRVKDYCARTCCASALHCALELKRRHPAAQVVSLYKDIRTYGRGQEELYERASEAGIVFVRFDGRRPPKVERDPLRQGRLVVRANDLLTGGAEIEVPADLVVLVAGVVPHDIAELTSMFRCAVGADRFLLEVHPKLRPVELAVSGVFLAGSCQGPMNVKESAAAASAAASKAAAMLAQGLVEMDPFIARVDEALCSGCRTCQTVCPYGAVSRDDARRVATINEALCMGCGTCAATCPSDAIQQAGFTDPQVLAEVAMLLAGLRAEPAPVERQGGAQWPS